MNSTHPSTTSLNPPELGLVCITASDKVRFRSLTRKRLLQFDSAQQEDLLRNLYTENLKRLSAAVDFCESENIHLYRMSSALLPFSDTAVGEAILTEFAAEMKRIGDRARSIDLRLVLHPDQFVVLNSDRSEVIENSIKILTNHARIMDMLGLPQSPWALMNIHGGKGNRAETLIRVIKDLPDSVRLRLTLENDEYTYGVEEILAICRETNIPMVFDAHHHAVHEKLDTYEDPSVLEAVIQARSTWKVPEWQLVHISNGDQSFLDPRHSDYITQMPSAYWQTPWIEIEAKHKEKAIAKLREEWLPQNPSLGRGKKYSNP